jgi:tetratricopeptide (TPR) repeat protein
MMLSLAGEARASVEESPEREAARRHSERGLALYGEARYREALGEYAIASQILSLPALDYNLGRCHERLEEWGRAADAYERYLSRAPDDADAPALRAHVAELRARQQAVDRLRAAETSAAVRRAAIGVGASAVALGAVWAGLFGAVGTGVAEKRDSCGTRCSPVEVSGLRTLQTTSLVFAALGGAALAVDIALWTVYARRRAPRR